VPVSKAQMLYVHIIRHTTFVSLRLTQKQFCGHSTFVLQTTDMHTNTVPMAILQEQAMTTKTQITSDHFLVPARMVCPGKMVAVVITLFRQ